MRGKKDTPQAVKILRLARDLAVEKLTIQQIARRFEISVRTAYRYIAHLEEADLMVDVDFNRRYFIHQ